MAAIRPDHHSSGSSSHEKKGYATEPQDYPQETHSTDDELEDDHHSLHRGLKARQITMIAIGGAIGTGLIIGT